MSDPNSDNEGWIAWHGGECPLPSGTLHEVKLGGHRPQNIMRDANPDTWNWDDSSRPIIAYRVIEPASDEPPNDGVLTGSALHRAIADAMDEGHPVDGEWWRHFDWRPAGDHEWRTAEAPDEVTSSDYAGHGEVRRKPRVCTIIANGVDYTFPAPMTDAPKDNKYYYVTFDRNGLGCPSRFWFNGNVWGEEWLAQGRCHATREARDAHERALIAVSGGRVTV